jgi:hypothetical protein
VSPWKTQARRIEYQTVKVKRDRGDRAASMVRTCPLLKFYRSRSLATNGGLGANNTGEIVA